MPIRSYKVARRPKIARSGAKKLRSIKTLKRLLDEVFSKYIRTKYLKDGYNTCYCGAKILPEESDASHYVSRGCLALRWDERNVHPSCRSCNRYRGGNLQAYAVYLEATYGEGILQELAREKEKIVKLSPQWYEEKIAFYKKMVE